jgi:hypothetical protein
MLGHAELNERDACCLGGGLQVGQGGISHAHWQQGGLCGYIGCVVLCNKNKNIWWLADM